MLANLAESIGTFVIFVMIKIIFVMIMIIFVMIMIIFVMIMIILIMIMIILIIFTMIIPDQRSRQMEEVGGRFLGGERWKLGCNDRMNYYT